MTQPDQTPIKIEAMPAGLEVFLHHDNTILAMRGISMTREAVDSFWEQARLHAQRCRAKGQPYLLLYQAESITLSPYARHVGTESIRSFSDLSGRVAIIFNRANPLIVVLRQFILRDMGRSLPKFQIREFRDNAAALVWLAETTP